MGMGLRTLLRRFAGTALVMLAATVVRAQEPQEPPPSGPVSPLEFAVLVSPDLRVATCQSTGVVVSYPRPTVITACTNGVTILCSPESGSVFPLGETTVECAVLTACGERTNLSFTVNVLLDTAAPNITCPTNIIAYATSSEGAVVHFELPNINDLDPATTVICTTPSGSTFPIGVTTVNCAAVDSCGRTNTCSFQVEVRRAEMRIQRASVPGPTGSAEPGVVVSPIGLEGLDVATAIDGDWEPLGNESLNEPLGIASAKFYRPGVSQGVKRGPNSTAEVKYVNVGLLRAYPNPPLNLGRQKQDHINDDGVKLLGGTDGGSGANLWSGVKNLPFTFYYFGRPYKTFRVSKNGLLTFSTNIVSGTEGLSYFNFAQAAITNSLTNSLPLPTNSFAVDNTIFCMAGRHVTQDAGDEVYGFVHGTAPYRQVWVIYRHPKDFYGNTITGIVLEETSNRILLMDMMATTKGIATNRLIAGIQGELGNTREASQVPATPNVRLMSENAILGDNGAYLFRPYTKLPSSGSAAASLMTATNLDLFIAEQVRRRNLPGITVAVSRNGRLIFNKAYGWANVESNITMQPYHRACIGSVSKVLAAIGVEKLIDLRAIPSLDSWAFETNRLGKPWFWSGVRQGLTNNIHTLFGSNNFLSNLTNTTIRHLLSHSAAFANRNDDLGAARAYANSNYTELTAQQHVQWFMATNPQRTNGVGLVSLYSNPTFKQVGVLIEEVAGQPFEQWMQNNVMKPAGVHFARLMRTYENEETWRDARRYHHAIEAAWANSRITGSFGPVTYGDAIYANAADGAAGSWTATAADLARLMAALDGFNNHSDILSSNRVAELDARAIPSMPGDQGIGWDNVVFGNVPYVEKDGNIGYGSAFVRRRIGGDRLTVAVVCNSGAGVGPVCAGVFNAVVNTPQVAPFYDLFGLQFAGNE
jgi:CubicO group peptidase (beta-lactamase class C family)